MANSVIPRRSSLTPQQQELLQQKQYFGTARRSSKNYDEDGNLLSVEEEPEQTMTSHPITPEEFHGKARGGRAKRKPGGKVEGGPARPHLGRRARGS